MTTPHLDARIKERKARRKRVAIGTAIIVAIVIVTIAVVLNLAGRWGVPGFSFRNEYGSTCTNDLTGYVCDPITQENVTAVAGTDLPPEAELLGGHYTESGKWSMSARFRLPKPVAKDTVKQLKEDFGGCVEHAPSTLKTEPGLSRFCVMTDENAPEKQSPDKAWTVTTARAESGDTIVQLDVSER